jgi:imidazoleglycerol-phosphate dehydratase
VDTGLKFFDHMLSTFGRYAGLDLKLHARGDLTHHLMEDVAITLGTAVQKVIPATAARFAERTIPMDDALVQACLDAGGRFYYRGPLKNRLYEHFMRSFSEHAKVTLHLRVLRGKDSHHATEAAFKALGLALRDAMVDSGTVFSMKGSVALEVK